MLVMGRSSSASASTSASRLASSMATWTQSQPNAVFAERTKRRQFMRSAQSCQQTTLSMILFSSALVDTTEFLDVDVDQLARPGESVALGAAAGRSWRGCPFFCV